MGKYVLFSIIVPDRTHFYRHTALPEVSNRIVGENSFTYYLKSQTIFLLMWGLQVSLFGRRNSLV